MTILKWLYLVVTFLETSFDSLETLFYEFVMHNKLLKRIILKI
jgi:hypothetical protein